MTAARAFLLSAVVGALLAGCQGRLDPGPVSGPEPAPDVEPEPSVEPAPEPEPAPAACPDLDMAPGLGGPADAELTLAAAQAQVDFRAAREEERLLEAWQPDIVRRRYRLEQAWIDDGCVDLAHLVDVGRGLFMRSFTLEEGLGNDLAGKHVFAGDRARPNLRRFQKGSPGTKGSFGGPDATSCLSCHWKGGLGGAGDRADNMVFLTDSDDEQAAEIRNPPGLWGAGWTQAVAVEMTAALAAQRDGAMEDAAASGESATVALVAKGISFGTLTATPDGALDLSAVEGVDDDLVIKPFGWKGVFDSLRSFLLVSANGHLGMQAEELLVGVEGGRVTEVDVGLDDADDPDDDGVRRELTEGQITALAAYLATTDAPRVLVPEQPELAVRWEEGAQRFEALGCAHCHVPMLPLQNTTFTTLPRLSGEPVSIDLASDAASPKPTADESGTTWVPVFSDFKRHHMGALLAGRVVEHGVSVDVFMTRRLWGLYNTAPYLHDASAATLDEAIAMHAGEGSEARPAAEAYLALEDDDRASVRVFLLSLVRGPAIRVR
jgi:hypothetical protein